MSVQELIYPHRKLLLFVSMVFLLSVTILSNAIYFASRNDSKPHIIFILADDLGWNDVSFHGSPQIPTPNIDALAASGIILNNYYATPQCTPSRASLMTGMYPFNIGLQHFIIRASEPTALSLKYKILPQHLKNLGYATHMVGKWHLGYYKKEYTPTYRGFDSFFGFWNGVLDYYDYTNFEPSDNPRTNHMWGIDLHNGTHDIKDFRGKYATDVFTQQAMEIISKHEKSQPLFLFLSHLACHTGNSYHRIQAPPELVAKFNYIKEPDRRTYAGVVSSLDDSVGKIFQSLHEKSMLDNSIIVFSSDNGGDNGIRGGRASNWPLRGMKMQLWEGGTRVPAAVWSPLLKLKEPRISKQLMHITDWLPTLYNAAGGDIKDLGETDGMDMWEHLLDDIASHRMEIPLNIDQTEKTAALRQGDYKLIYGSYPGNLNYWYGPSGRENVETSSLHKQIEEDKSVVKAILKNTGRWILERPTEWQENATIKCEMDHKVNKLDSCNPKELPCLFNLREDPCEYHDLAPRFPQLVNSMMTRIRELESRSARPLTKPLDPRGDPRCHEFAYVSWLDEDKLKDCPWQ